MSTTNPIAELLKQHIQSGDNEAVEKLLQDNANFNLNETYEGESLLHLAVKEDQRVILKLFISRGATVNYKHGDNLDSPLHVAVRDNKMDVTKILLDNNSCDVNIKNLQDDTPLHIALQKNRIEIGKELLKRCADGSFVWNVDINQPNGGGESARSIIERRNKPSWMALIRNPLEADQLPSTSTSAEMIGEYEVTSGGMSGLEGSMYQVLVFILVCMRAFKNFTNFQIMTEMEAAGKLDDIIIRYLSSGGWLWRFIQLKHKNSEKVDKNKITKNALQKRDGEFELSKYLESIIDLKLEGIKTKQGAILRDTVFEDFIVCTTASLDATAEVFFERQDAKFRDDVLLFFEGDATLSRLNQEKPTKLANRQAMQEKCQAKNLELESVLNEVRGKFYFLTSYPTVKQLSELLIKEIGDHFKLHNPVLINDSFVNKITNHIVYFRNKPMNKSDVLEFLEKVKANLSIQQCIALTNQNISESDALRIAFNQSFSRMPMFLEPTTLETLLTIRTKYIELATTNVINEVRKKFTNSDEYFVLNSKNFQDSENSDGIFQAIKRGDIAVCVLIACESQLREICELNSNTKIISIERSIEAQAEDAEKLCFENLRGTSQEAILNKNIYFQGKKVVLKKILSRSNAKTILTPHNILALAMGEEISLAEEADVEGPFSLQEIYIERILEERNRDERERNVRRAGSRFEEKSIIDGTAAIAGRIAVVSGEPGMGKSSLMKKFKVEMQKPDHWVILINLNDFSLDDNAEFHLSKITFREQDVQAALQFLIGMLRSVYKGSVSSNHMTFEFLKVCLLSNNSSPCPRVTILFDAFDEIAPLYEKNVLLLVKALGRSNVARMWITTRPHLNEKLVQQLGTSKYHLTPFSSDDQIDFLLQHCNAIANANESLSEDFSIRNSNFLKLFEIIVANKLNPLSQRDDILLKYNSLRNSLGQPEQEQVFSPDFYIAEAGNLASMLETPLQFKMLLDICLDPEPFANISLNGVYQRFIDRRFTIFFREKAHATAANAAVEAQEETRSAYEKNHYRFACLTLFPDAAFAFVISDDELSRIVRVGLISKRGNICQFIHRSFAEFFAANHFMDLKFERDFVLLNRVLLMYEFKIVCVFLNDKLKHRGQDVRPACQCPDDAFLGTKTGNALHIASQRGHIEIIKYLRKFVAAPTMANLAGQPAGPHRRTVLDEAALSPQYFELFNIFQDILGETLLRNLMRGSEKYAHRLLRTAAYSGDFRKLIEFFSVFMSDEPICKFMCRALATQESIAHMAAFKGSFRAFTDIIVPLFDNDNEGLKKILLSSDFKGSTILHVASEVGRIEQVFALLSNLLGANDLQELTERTNLSEETMLHAAVNTGYFPTTSTVLLNYCGAERFKELLRKKHFNGGTCLFNAADCGRYSEVVPFYEQNFSASELTSLLTACDSEGSTLLHCAARSENFTVVARSLHEHLGEETFKNFLLEQDCRYRLCLHIAAKYGKYSEVFSFYSSRFDESELNQLLSATDHESQTLLHYAADGNFVLTARALFEHMGREAFKNFLSKKTSNGANCLHFAAEHLRCKEIMAFFGTLYEGVELTEILLETDKNDMTLLHLAASNGNFESMAASLISYLGVEQFKGLLSQRARSGRTCLHIAAEYGAGKVAISALLPHYEAREIAEVLLMGDDLGRTVLHETAMHGDFFFAATLLKEAVEEERFKAILWGPDSKGRSCWDVVCEYESYDNIFSFLTLHFEKGDIAEILLACDQRNGQPFWFGAVQSCCFPDTAKLLHEHIGVQKFKATLLSKDNDGRTCLYSVTASKQLSEVIAWLARLYDKDEVFSILSDSDQNGQTLLHSASLAGCFAAVSNTLLANFGKANFGKAKFKTLLLKKDQDNETCLHSAAQSDRFDEALSILETAFDKSEIIELLLPASNSNEQTILHSATKSRYFTVAANCLLDYTDKATLKSLLLRRDKEGQTCLSILWRRLERVIEFLKIHYNANDLIDIFSQPDPSGQTVLHLASQRGKAISLASFMLENLEKDVLKSLLPMKDHSGRTCLHLAVQFENFKKLFSIFSDLCDESAIIDTLSTIDNCNGETILHTAIQNRTFQKNFGDAAEAMRQHLGAEKFKALLVKTDTEGKTCLHLAAAFELFFPAMSIFASNCEESELIAITLTPGKSGDTILHSAALTPYFDSVASTLLDHLSEEQLKKLLLMKDKDGRTPLYRASKPRDFLEVIYVFTDHFSAIEMFEILSQPDNSGLAALHHAIVQGCFPVAASLLFKKLEKQKFKELLLTRDVNNKNCLQLAAENSDSEKLLAFIQDHYTDEELDELFIAA